eukprot:7429890-Lingulodinium_polyedra.AAC.1
MIVGPISVTRACSVGFKDVPAISIRHVWQQGAVVKTGSCKCPMDGRRLSEFVWSDLRSRMDKLIEQVLGAVQPQTRFC